MITEEALEAAGWSRIIWNRVLPEYWRTTKPGWKKERHFDNRVGVRFGDWGYSEIPSDFCVWIVSGSSVMACPQVRTMEDLNTLLGLVSYKE